MITPPSLDCPFPRTPPNPHAEALVVRSLDWVDTWRLAPDDARTRAAVRSYSRLAASCYPDAPFERLSAIGDYYSWLFFFDDACEDLSIDGASPADVARFLDDIYGVLDGRPVPAGRAAAFGPPLVDIWKRIAPTCAPTWRRRLKAHVANYVDGCVWEADNRLRDRVPSRAVYQAMRMFTSTMYEFWDFIEYAGGFELPDDVVQHPVLVELQRTGNAVASYANDIYSLRKETENQDFHNLVVVLQHAESLSLAAAYARAAAIHDEEVRHFSRLERAVPSFGDDVDRHVAKYVEGMRIWMRANYDWSKVTPRYAAQGELAAPERAARRVPTATAEHDETS